MQRSGREEARLRAGESLSPDRLERGDAGSSGWRDMQGRSAKPAGKENLAKAPGRPHRGVDGAGTDAPAPRRRRLSGPFRRCPRRPVSGAVTAARGRQQAAGAMRPRDETD